MRFEEGSQNPEVNPQRVNPLFTYAPIQELSHNRYRKHYGQHSKALTKPPTASDQMPYSQLSAPPV